MAGTRHRLKKAERKARNDRRASWDGSQELRLLATANGAPALRGSLGSLRSDGLLAAVPELRADPVTPWECSVSSHSDDLSALKDLLWGAVNFSEEKTAGYLPSSS